MTPVSGRLPTILQGAQGECGLAALAMVAHYHGHRAALGELRRRFLLSRRGSTLENLVRVAEVLELEARVLKLDLDGLSELKLPCVLHWDLNHFLVLERMTPRWLWLRDPAFGARRLSYSEFGKHFTGIAIELFPAANFKPAEPSPPFQISRLLGRVAGLRRSALQVMGLALALECVSLALPFQLQWVVDHGLVSADRELIGTLSAGFLLLVLLQTAIAGLRGWLIATLSVHLNFQWLAQVFAHLLKLPLVYFERRHLGGIQSRFASLDQIQHTLTTDFAQAVVDGVLVCGTFVMMLLYSPSLSGVALATLLAYLALRAALFRRLHEANAQKISFDALQHTHFLETVRGIQSVRLFGREPERRMGWTNLLAEQFNAILGAHKLDVVRQCANVGLFGAERVIVIWLAALAVVRAELSLGMLFAFLSYKEQFSQRASGLLDKLYELRMLGLHLERVADIVDAEPERDEPEPEASAAPRALSIELRDVCFRYAMGEPLVLDGINLAIEPGECVAISGSSGSGKTTLVKVMLGLFQPTSGEVRVGGRALQCVGLSNYRALIGTVMQDDSLFTGSVADNIAFFDVSPDLAHIEQCARMAAVHAEIERLPMGYETLLSDNGSGLSGGQKQRILLARALYKKPQILVLDEATSHLDVLNERAVNAAIRATNLTRIIVAHRPETLRMADRVIRLEDGRIVA